MDYHGPDIVAAEIVPIDSLRPHPRNYQGHPDDQIEHIVASIREHGVYRNIVVARDGTILAGHGVVAALRRLNVETVQVARLDVDPDSPAALRVLTGDNEISHLAERDDRGLTELLREISSADPLALLGTGFDQSMLANLVYVTRPASEVQDFDAAAHWAGMPDYAASDGRVTLSVHLRTPADRDAFLARLGITLDADARGFWWPAAPEREDLASVRFEG